MMTSWPVQAGTDLRCSMPASRARSFSGDGDTYSGVGSETIRLMLQRLHTHIKQRNKESTREAALVITELLIRVIMLAESCKGQQDSKILQSASHRLGYLETCNTICTC